jgi:phosphoribosyl-AMP cyclohydrolase
MDASRLRYDEHGLIPAIVQQHDTGEVLMLAWMSAATVRESLALGETVFWSRSRAERWHKGATSGNTQKIVSITADCDADVLLVAVDQRGSGACHTGARTCFHHHLRVRASVSEPVGGDLGVRASVSEPVGGDLETDDD